MTLRYRFSKERADGRTVFRPRVYVKLIGPKDSVSVHAILDTGSDISILPKSFGDLLGVESDGKETTIEAFHEKYDAVPVKLNVVFLGKVERQSVNVDNVPFLIPLEKSKKWYIADDVILGIERIFDCFDITLKKSENRIEL